MAEAMHNVSNLPIPVLDLAASVLGASPSATGAQLKTNKLLVAHASNGFMHRRFAAVQEYPFSLCKGDIAANLVALAEGPRPQDGTACKIRDLVLRGWGNEQLIESIELMQEIHFSTNIVEQGHGSTAVVHKQHPGYSGERIVVRALLHSCRALFVKPPKGKADAAELLGRKVKRIKKMQPQKITGRHMFAQDAFNEIPPSWTTTNSQPGFRS